MKNMNVKALVKLVGINPNTLRGWERRYQALRPERTEDGRRMYSSKDIERVRYLWQLVQNGHTIGLIAKLPTSELKKMVEDQRPKFQPSLNPDYTGPSTLVHMEEIIRALNQFDLELLNNSLLRARFTMSPRNLILDLVQPLLSAVGEQVMNNKLSIAQEHLLSALLKDYLGSLYSSLNPYNFLSNLDRPSVLFATREGDLHEFGIIMSAILAKIQDYRTYQLGPNVPADELIEAAEQFKVNAIVLGLMKLPKKRELISSMEFLKILDQKLPRKIDFVLGGSDLIDLESLSTDRKILKLKDFKELEQYFESGVS